MGALSGDPGRRPTTVSVSSSSAVSGSSSRAARSRSWTAPAVTVVSKPCSSTVAPTTTRPSPRGTTYTSSPRTLREHSGWSPGPLAGGQERLDQRPVVDLVVAGGQHAAADARVQARLELAALAAAQALDLQPAAELEPVQVLQGRVVVGVAGHGQGPAGAVAD